MKKADEEATHLPVASGAAVAVFQILYVCESRDSLSCEPSPPAPPQHVLLQH